MLLEFSVSNFRSFRKRQTLSLAASAQDKSLPENCIPLELPGATPRQWLKGIAIYGANASGKTTILEGLKALGKFVTTSAGATDPRDPILHVEPFALCAGGGKEPAAWEVVLVAEGVRYTYRVAATQERIWHESLRAFTSAKGQTWFQRDWSPESRTYQWTPERPTDFPRDSRLESDTLSNMLYLSKHIASNRTELEPIFRWFKERLSFLHLDANWNLSGDYTLSKLHEKGTSADRIVALLRHADLGVLDASRVERPARQDLIKAFEQAPEGLREHMLERLKQPSFEPQLLHRGEGGASYPLPWKAESAGTHRLFALAALWLNILADGDVVFIDELDTSMHPLMVAELLRLLFSAEYSPNAAQVIFTTHNPLLLDTTLLRRDQVWFADKDAAGEGHLYPLTDYTPRKDESLVRGYLSGRYGAVPFVPNGLLGQRTGFSEAHSETNERAK